MGKIATPHDAAHQSLNVHWNLENVIEVLELELCPLLQYAQRAYLINEFTDGRWQDKPFPGTGQFVGYTLGNGILGQYGFPGKLCALQGAEKCESKFPIALFAAL